MLVIHRPPAPLPASFDRPSVFLAGSIEMGRAPPWQDEVAAALAGRRLALLNPRRASWDASWTQSIHNPEFRAQVEWELAAQERADHIAMYFAPRTQAPITLLELGLFARSGKIVACCPPGFWRKGNVEVVCAWHGVPLVESFSELIAALLQRLGSAGA